MQVVMDLPTINDQYAMKNYWNERYTIEADYDWFAKYESFAQHVDRTIRRSDRILQLGCGNSSLAMELYNDGFKNLVNTDYSPVVISHMQSKYASLDGVEWIVMDVMDMSEFPHASFDVVLEKGTLDALLVGEKDPWRLSSEAEDVVDAVLKQVSQLLKPDGGQFISITFAQPHFRVPLYIADPVYNWSIDVDTFGTGFHYFYYTMTRGLEPSHDALQRRHSYEQRRMLCRDVTPVSNSDTEDFSLAAFNVDTG